MQVMKGAASAATIGLCLIFASPTYAKVSCKELDATPAKIGAATSLKEINDLMVSITDGSAMSEEIFQSMFHGNLSDVKMMAERILAVAREQNYCNE